MAHESSRNVEISQKTTSNWTYQPNETTVDQYLSRLDR